MHTTTTRARGIVAAAAALATAVAITVPTHAGAAPTPGSIAGNAALIPGQLAAGAIGVLADPIDNAREFWNSLPFLGAVAPATSGTTSITSLPGYSMVGQGLENNIGVTAFWLAHISNTAVGLYGQQADQGVPIPGTLASVAGDAFTVAGPLQSSFNIGGDVLGTKDQDGVTSFTARAVTAVTGPFGVPLWGRTDSPGIISYGPATLLVTMPSDEGFIGIPGFAAVTNDFHAGAVGLDRGNLVYENQGFGAGYDSPFGGGGFEVERFGVAGGVDGLQGTLPYATGHIDTLIGGVAGGGTLGLASWTPGGDGAIYGPSGAAGIQSANEQWGATIHGSVGGFTSSPTEGVNWAPPTLGGSFTIAGNTTDWGSPAPMTATALRADGAGSGAADSGTPDSGGTVSIPGSGAPDSGSSAGAPASSDSAS